MPFSAAPKGAWPNLQGGHYYKHGAPNGAEPISVAEDTCKVQGRGGVCPVVGPFTMADHRLPSDSPFFRRRGAPSGAGKGRRVRMVSCARGRKLVTLNSTVDLTAKNAKITKTDCYAWIAIAEVVRKLRRFNAEAQRFAEIRREFFFSAFLRVPLRLCVKSCAQIGNPRAELSSVAGCIRRLARYEQ